MSRSSNRVGPGRRPGKSEVDSAGVRERQVFRARFGLVIAVALGWLWASGPVLASPSVPDGAYGEVVFEGRDRADPKVELRLLADVSEARAGEPFRAGVLIDLDRGWHVYWRNSGESGIPTRLEWQIPDAELGPVEWPAPEVFGESDGIVTTYGYQGQVLLANEVVLDPAAYAPGDTAELRLEVELLACLVQCIPGRATLQRTLPVGERSQLAGRGTLSFFERYADLLPQPPETLGIELEALYSQSAVRPGDRFRAALAVVGRDRLGRRDAAAAFVPDRTEGIELEITGSRPHPFSETGLLITLAGAAGDRDPGRHQRLRGVLALLGTGLRPDWVEVDLPLPRARAGAEVSAYPAPWFEPVAPAGMGIGLGQAVLFALLGGLILNLMPCVLPVLAIKVFSLTELAQQGRRELLANGFAYTSGILATMGLLAVSVAGLRAAGISVGWGFQFQEPLFIVAISAVFVVFALNLFGVFEITIDATRLSQVGASGSARRQSFFEGLLAVIVATPCSAPFLGAAVGLAFASPPPVVVAVFLAIGVGLASPYLLITAVPAWARLIPRPGPWMLQLRRVLGFALLGTVVWLLWILGQSTGVMGVTILLAFLVAVALATFVYAGLQSARRPGLAWISVLVLGALSIGALLRFPFEVAPAQAGIEEPARAFGRNFDRAAIRQELEQGRAVFVYFTADWCLTCKVNEYVVLNDARVQGEIERLDVATFKADWTRRDERIRAELARFGRAGVPVYLVYSPEDPEHPALLSELLTVDTVLEALRAAAPPRAG